MKNKFTITALAMGFPIAMFAQSAKPTDGSQSDRFGVLAEKLNESNVRTESEGFYDFTQRGGGSVVWEETFSNGADVVGGLLTTDQGTWEKSAGDGLIWKHSLTSTDGCWSGGTTALAFSTVSNGFLLFDADSANCVDPAPNPPIFNQDVLFGSLVSPAIDLSSTPFVALSFEYATRWCCAEQLISVALSSDGGNTWSAELPIVSPLVNANMQSDFDQNVSALIGGSSNAKIRFTWAGASHYYLAIDDIKLTIPPSDDVRMNYALITHNGTSEEYGRVPLDQLHPTITVGAEAYNFGTTPQTNVNLDVDFTLSGNPAFTGSDSQGSLAPLDTIQLTDTPTTSGLGLGVYTGTFTVSSDNDTLAGGNFGNNTATRKFSITQSLYSIDGIGIHPSVQTSSLGTNSFTGGEDGFMALNYYDISSTTTTIGLEIVLATGTQAGSSLVVSLHDTADVFQDDVTLFFAESEIYDVTQQNVNNGTIQVMFDEAVELQPGAYFAGVEMFSNTGANVIRIADDVTVPQPFYSSMIFIPDDAVYSNGNALAIRLIADPTLSINEEQASQADLTVYPNPSSGNAVELVMRSSHNEMVNWELVDVTGALISVGSFSTVSGRNVETIDVAGVSSGVYFIKVASNNYYGIERIVVGK